MPTIIEKVIFLQNVDIFSEVPTEHLAHLAAITDEINFEKDDTVYQQNDPSDALYLVLDGSVRLHQDNQEITTAGSKEAFGTWALFDEAPRVVTATAIDDSRLLRIDRDDFIDLLADNVKITQGVLKAMANRLRGLMGRVISK
ncbi:MAG: cyclic nucleotide-binding domain-containing protein [candidate division Zixibacteria bacterium]|nr:cyclic nucleotide-binding domain-containing protein [candidate division Zixibacteria bacterium]